MTEPYRCIASLTDRSPMCKRQTSGLRIPMRCIEKKTKKGYSETTILT